MTQTMKKNLQATARPRAVNRAVRHLPPTLKRSRGGKDGRKANERSGKNECVYYNNNSKRYLLIYIKLEVF